MEAERKAREVAEAEARAAEEREQREYEERRAKRLEEKRRREEAEKAKKAAEKRAREVERLEREKAERQARKKRETAEQKKDKPIVQKKKTQPVKINFGEMKKSWEKKIKTLASKLAKGSAGIANGPDISNLIMKKSCAKGPDRTLARGPNPELVLGATIMSV